MAIDIPELIREVSSIDGNINALKQDLKGPKDKVSLWSLDSTVPPFLEIALPEIQKSLNANALRITSLMESAKNLRESGSLSLKEAKDMIENMLVILKETILQLGDAIKYAKPEQVKMTQDVINKLSKIYTNIQIAFVGKEYLPKLS